MKSILVAAMFVVACGAKTPPTDTFGSDGKADSFSSKMKIVRTAGYGDPTFSVRYTSTPRYRAVQFDGAAGDSVDAWVRSTTGDPVTWLLDGSYHVVTSNDDADASTTDSHITATLANDDTYYVVFRDYNLESHSFTVTLTGGGGCAIALNAGGSNSGVTRYQSELDGAGVSYALTTRKLPSCVDLTDAPTLTKVREAVRTAKLVGTSRSTVTASPATAGGLAFIQLIDASLQALHAAVGANATADQLEAAIKRPVIATPDAFLEIQLAASSASCSESAVALIDTRTGTVYNIHQQC
jgi:hypothetical protein